MKQRNKAIFVGAIIVIAAAFGIIENFGTTQNQVSYLIPFYVSPDTSAGQSAYNSLIAAAQAQPTVNFVVVINPNTGPGAASDANYVNYVGKMQAAGMKVLGYDWTAYGAASSAAVEQNMTDYKNWYNVNGIFLDAMNNAAGGASYYQGLTTYGHANGMSLIIGVPGSTTTSAYVGSVDVIIVYENAGLPSASNLASYVSVGGTANQWGFLAYSVSTAPSVSYIQSVSPYADWIYVTDSSGFRVAPTYQSTELQNIFIANGGSTATTSTTGTSSTSTSNTTTTAAQGTTSSTMIGGASTTNTISQVTIGLFTSGTQLAYFIGVVLIVAVASFFLARRKRK